MTGAVRPLASGLAALALLVAGFGLWAAFARIESAIIAPGRVEVQGGAQPLRHPDGGVVTDVFVSEGEVVAAGQALIRLDASGLQPELSAMEAQLHDLTLRRARLIAERDGAEQPDFSPEDTGELALFVARRAAEAQQVALLGERRRQIASQIEGLGAEAASLMQEEILVASELDIQQGLLGLGLVQTSRVLALERDRAAMAGRQAQIAAAISRAEAALDEVALQIEEIATHRRAEAAAQLRELETTRPALEARRDMLAARIEALILRAPAAGEVWGLQITRAPAVLRPGEAALHLLPADAPLLVSARVAPGHIGQLSTGQRARLRLTAFDPHHMPELIGLIVHIAPDTAADPPGSAPFYRVEIALELQSGAPDAPRPRPGMEGEVLFPTGAQSPAQFLLHPLLAHFRRTFRDG